MKTNATIGLLLALLGSSTSCTALAQGTDPGIQTHLAAASQAYDRRDYPAVIEHLLPLEQSGRLKTAGPLMWLALSCEQATLPPRNHPHACHKRRVEIMLEAAEMGNPYAMYGASIGLLDTGMGRFGIRLPFADDGKRVDALMWALLAADLASDGDLRGKASERARQLSRNLQQEWRGQETLAQRAMRKAEARKPGLQALAARNQGNAPAASGKVAGWLDPAAQRKPLHYVMRSGTGVVVEDLDGTDTAPDASDEGVAPSIDRASIVRNGDRVQYVYSGMDEVTLIQAHCSGGMPTLIWAGDFEPDHPEDSNRWVFQPATRQPIPRDSGYLEYYGAITRKACALSGH